MSQFKDEETIENALKSCHENVRLMKSGAVLMEVLGLLERIHAKDALSALANFLNNNSQEKRRHRMFLKVLLKMKELIPTEEMDVFVPFLKDQETKKNAWICVENLVLIIMLGSQESTA